MKKMIILFTSLMIITFFLPSREFIHNPAEPGTTMLITQGIPGENIPSYWLYLPENYETSRTLPIMIFLHGGGAGKDPDTEKLICGHYIDALNLKPLTEIPVWTLCNTGDRVYGTQMRAVSIIEENGGEPFLLIDNAMPSDPSYLKKKQSPHPSRRTAIMHGLRRTVALTYINGCLVLKTSLLCYFFVLQIMDSGYFEI